MLEGMATVRRPDSVLGGPDEALSSDQLGDRLRHPDFFVREVDTTTPQSGQFTEAKTAGAGEPDHGAISGVDSLGQSTYLGQRRDRLFLDVLSRSTLMTTGDLTI